MNPTPAHIVAAGETLGQIARQHGKTVAELVRINRLSSPDQIKPGQAVYLDKAYANSVQVLLLDALRHPIEGLECLLKFDGRAVSCSSSARGLLPLVSTRGIDSLMDIFVKDRLGQWQKIGQTMSGLGRKWVTLVSDGIRFDAPLEKHDPQAAEKPFVPAYDQGRRHDGNAQGEPIRPGHPIRQRKGDQHNTTILECDFPQKLLGYFAGYREYELTATDWDDAANLVRCDVAVLKAIHHVEAPRGAFYNKRLQNGSRIPTLLFERHYFHRLTCANGPYLNTSKRKYHGAGVAGCHSDHDDDPDICGPTGFAHYGSYDQAYLRLAKAYRIDPVAALKSVSWGGFQIMGENYHTAAFESVEEMAAAMCTSRKEHLTAVANFIFNTPALRDAVRQKDWAKIARIYNGSNYAHYRYDEKLQAAYEKYRRET